MGSNECGPRSASTRNAQVNINKFHATDMKFHFLSLQKNVFGIHGPVAIGSVAQQKLKAKAEEKFQTNCLTTRAAMMWSLRWKNATKPVQV